MYTNFKFKDGLYPYSPNTEDSFELEYYMK